MKHNAKEVNKVIGRSIRTVRLFNESSQEEAGKALGVTFQQIQKYENGSNRISASNLFVLCKFYNRSLRSFFSLVEAELRIKG